MLLFGGMTRSLAASRLSRPKSQRVFTRGPRARDPRFNRLGFTCFRLIPITDGEPHETPFAPIELMTTTNAMGAFMLLK